MAAKKRRPSPLEEPPTASSSDSEDDQPPSSQQQGDEVVEEVASSEEEEEASSEEEEDQPSAPSQQPASKNPPPPTTNSHPKPSSSSSSSDSGSGSDTDSDAEAEAGPPAPPANSKVKPLASKPMDQTPKARAQAQPSPAPARSTTKRAAAENNASDPKRAKKKATEAPAAASGGGGSEEEVEEDGKKSGDDSKKLFQRLWSEEDEIAILKGLADFSSRTGNDPLKYVNEFHNFVKKSLHVDASITQLKQKIRRLKKKYETNAGKGKNDEGPTFSKPHDQKTFELSKKVWGTNEAEEKAKPNGKPTKSPKKEAPSRNAASAKKPSTSKKPVSETGVEHEPELPLVDYKESGKMEIDKVADTSLILSEMFRFDKGVGLCALNEDVVKRGVELIGESKRAELEGRWKKLQVAELELFVKRAELIEDQARLILEAYKSSNH